MSEDEADVCPYGDPACPCPDGLACHYEGEDPMTPPAAASPGEPPAMKKIPTLFVRDPENRKYVLPEVTPGCEWVLAGEGVATRKYDGTCVMYDGERWWSRREVKSGKSAPEGWVGIDHDEVTGKSVGWEPAEQGPFWKVHQEAIAGSYNPGTYELIGPKVQGNPERMDSLILVPHGLYSFDDANVPRDYAGLRRLFTDPDSDWPTRFEGVVWHHPDGRMVKLKRRDFPPPSASGRTPAP